MTDEEKAIAWCEDLIVQSKEIMPQCSEALKMELAEQMEFAETALSALRDRIAREKPLTLDEVEAMRGQAVFCVYPSCDTGGEWFLVNSQGCYKSGKFLSWRYYGEWLAYRTKPKEEGSENNGIR